MTTTIKKAGTQDLVFVTDAEFYPTGPDRLSLSGTQGNDVIYGGSFADSIFGLGGDDALYGQAGDDTLDGGAGDDYLVGGLGADMLVGGEGTDTASYIYAAGGVMIVNNAGYTGEASGDTLVGIENIRGSAHNDIIIGNFGVRHLDGGDGDDFITGTSSRGRVVEIIEGGAGNDTLRGATETDGFYPEAPSYDTFVLGLNTGSDLIMDFSSAYDSIQMLGMSKQYAFGNDGKLASGPMAGWPYLSASDNLFFNTETDQLMEVVRSNTGAIQRFDVIATFVNGATLTTDDFMFS